MDQSKQEVRRAGKKYDANGSAMNFWGGMQRKGPAQSKARYSSELEGMKCTMRSGRGFLGHHDFFGDNAGR